jgi:hypothetical protein
MMRPEKKGQRSARPNKSGRACVCVCVCVCYCVTHTMVSFLPVLALRTGSFLVIVIVAAILRLMFNFF